MSCHPVTMVTTEMCEGSSLLCSANRSSIIPLVALYYSDNALLFRKDKWDKTDKIPHQAETT